MSYYLDYSAAKLSGSTIKSAGYDGVIRYIDSPQNLGAKHTNLTEYQSHVLAGLNVLLVMQTTTSASDGGYSVGQDHARRAAAGAAWVGYDGPIFFTNDRTTVPNPAAWQAYLTGVVSVLGFTRVGAYGFRNAMDLAVGHATYFWQAGRRSDVAAHTHVWQDNNVQVTVGGITCDRNLILKSIGDNDSMDMSNPNDSALIYRINDFLQGNMARTQGGGVLPEQLPMVTNLLALAGRVEALVNNRGAVIWGPAKGEINRLQGTIASLTDKLGLTDVTVESTLEVLENVAAKVDGLQLAGVDVNALAAALRPLLPTAADVADELDRRNRDGNPNTGQAS